MIRRLTLFLTLVLGLQGVFAQHAVELFPDLIVKGEPEISAITQASSGGYFLSTTLDRINGIKTSCLSKIDASGNLVEGFAGVYLNNRIYHMEEVADGKILIAGTFTSVNGLSKSGLVRINADGTIDQTFTALGSGSATDATSFGVQQDGKIIVSGAFSKGGYTNVARLKTDGTIDNTFTPFPLHDRPIQGIQVDQNDNIYINGYSKIFKTNASGVQVTGFPVVAPANSAFYGIQMYGTKLLVRGYFSSIGEQTRNNLAIINEDGSIAAFNASSSSSNGKAVVKEDGTIILDVEQATLVVNANASNGPYLTTGFTQAMFVDSEQRLLVAGGNNFQANGIAQPYIVRFNNDFSVDNTFHCQVSFTTGVKVIAVYPDGKMVIGGDRGVKGIGNTSARLARLNANGTIDGSFTPELADDGIVSIALQGDKILVCGKQSLRRLTSTGALDNSFAQKSVTNWDEFTKVMVYDSKIYLSGAFSTVNGTLSPGIMRLNADGSVDETFSSPFTSAYVMNFTFQSSGKIIAVGPLSNENRGFHEDLTRLNTNGRIDATFDSGHKSGNGIYAVATDSQDNIYFAGDFTGYDGQVNRFGKLAAGGKLDLSFQPSLPFTYSDRITTLQVLNDNEIMAGVDYFPYNMYRPSWTSKIMAVVNSGGEVLTKYWDNFGFNASAPASFFDGTKLYVAGRLVPEGDNGVFSPVAIIHLNFVAGKISELKAVRPTSLQISLTWQNKVAQAEQLVIERSVGNTNNFSQLAVIGATQTAYTDNAGIDPSQAYYYRIKAINSVSETGYSNTASAMPLLFVNQASAVDTVSFKVSWNLLSTASNYKIELSDNSFASVLITKTTTNAFVKFEDLTPFKQYNVRVSYLYNSTYQPAQNTITVRTLPLAPVITAISVTSNNIIALGWINRFPQASEVRIFRSLSTDPQQFIQIATVDGTTESWSDTGLSDGIVYYYRLQAVGSSLSSGYSKVVSETTESVTFQIASIDTASFNIAWPPVASAGEYKLEMSTDDFVTTETTMINENTLLINDLEPYTLYSVRVSFVFNGVDHTSGIKSVRTLPESPLLIQAEALSRRTIQLSWVNRFDDATHIEIYRSSAVNGAYERVAKLEANVDSYGDTTLFGGREYFYKIKASTVDIKSPFSNVDNATTDALLSQTVIFDPLPEIVFSDTTFELSASATSGLEVQFKSDHRSRARIKGNLLTVVGAGTVVITASQPGDEDYESVFETRTLTILKAEQLVKFDPSATVVFTPGGNLGLAATATSGLTVTFESSNRDIVEIVDNVGIMKRTGIVTIKAIQDGGQNFEPAQEERTITITKADQSIAFTLAATYGLGSEEISLRGTATSGLEVTFESSDPELVSVVGNKGFLHKLGAVTITARQSGDENFNASADVAQNIEIVQSSQSLIFKLPIKEFGDEPFVLKADASSGLPIVYSSADSTMATIEGSTLTIHSAGTVAITARQEGNESFDPAETTVNLVILKAGQTIDFTLVDEIDILNKVGDVIPLEGTSSSGLPVTYTSSNSSIADVVNENQLAIFHPGNVKIIASQPGDNNYKVAAPIERLLKVRLITASEEVFKSEVEVFPNPSTQSFDVNTLSCFTDYVVISANGIVIDVGQVNSPRLHIDLSSHAAGTYYLLVQGCEKRLAFELVKQ
jgi:uncharacterized delta-60 repeat protein